MNAFASEMVCGVENIFFQILLLVIVRYRIGLWFVRASFVGIKFVSRVNELLPIESTCLNLTSVI